MESTLPWARFGIRRTIVRLVRSGAAGILATITNVGVLTALVSLGGMAPVAAAVPALVLGSIVMFLGQKYFVFEVRTAHTLVRETVLYVIVQVAGIALTAWLYKVFLALSPQLEGHYVLTNLLVNNVVWLFYFFPLWHFVFKEPPKHVVSAPSPAAAPVLQVPAGASGAPQVNDQ